MNGVKIKVVSANKEGKIELTKLELENLLNEAYRDGYCDGSKNSYTYTGISTTPYYGYNIASTSDATVAKSVTGKVATIDTDLTVLASDSKSSNCAIKAVKVEDANYVVQ